MFRSAMSRKAKLLLVALLGLSDQDHLDRPQYAKIADVLRAMGYTPDERPDGKTAFPTWLYETVEDVGMNLRRNSIPLSIREPATFTKDGLKLGKVVIVDMSILQDFGFYYEDDDGQPIDLAELPADQLIKYEGGKDEEAPLYAIPILDGHGNIVLKKDGTPRRRMATGVTWTISSRIARLIENRQTSWVFTPEAVQILNRYLSKPASFDLIFKTLFWAVPHLIEMSYGVLVQHLGIRAKDRRQVEDALARGFADMLKEGIIDKPVTVREKNYYKPTKKTGRARRIDQVYQWRQGAKWHPKGNQVDVLEDVLDAVADGQTESPKDGKTEQGL